jgi:hypothetical protein
MGSPEAGPDPFEEDEHDIDDESHGNVPFINI